MQLAEVLRISNAEIQRTTYGCMVNGGGQNWEIEIESIYTNDIIIK